MRERAARLEVVRAEAEHAEEVAAFIRNVWNPSTSAASVLAAREAGARHNVAEPGTPPPTWIALQGGKVLGYVTTLPVRFWNGVNGVPGYWIKGLMVLPEVQGGPIGYHVLKAATNALPIAGGLAVAPAARRLFTALGYKDCGAVDNWVRPLRPARILQRLDVTRLGLSRLPGWIPRFMSVARSTGLSTLVGWAAGAVFRVISAMMRSRSTELSSEILDPSRHTSDLTALWQRSASSFPYGVVRDPAYLIPRYATGSDEPYTWLGVRRARSLVGIAILKTPREVADDRLAGIRVATLSDMLYDARDVDSGLALLGAAERAALTLDADAVVASSSGPSAVRLLRRQSYLPLGGSVHLLFRTASEAAAGFSDNVRDWWLQRGDGGADDAF